MPTKKPTKKPPAKKSKAPAASKVQKASRPKPVKKPAPKKTPPKKKAPAKKPGKKKSPAKKKVVTPKRLPAGDVTGRKPVTQHIAIVTVKPVETKGRGWCLVLQPNKMFARYSDMVCALTHMNMTRGQAEVICLRNGMTPEEAEAEIERAANDPRQWKTAMAWIEVEKPKALARLGIRLRD